MSQRRPLTGVVEVVAGLLRYASLGYKGVAMVLMAVHRIQNIDGNQEVQGSPRFVYHSARQAELTVTVTYLCQEMVEGSQKGSWCRSRHARRRPRRLACHEDQTPSDI